MIKINKKSILFSLIIITSIFLGCNVNALAMARVTNEIGADLRTKPDATLEKTVRLAYNDVLPVISTIKEPASKGCSAGWYKLNHNGEIRYACSNLFSISNYTLKVNSKTPVNIRTGAGTNYPIYNSVTNDKVMTIYSITRIKGTGCTNKWYRLNYSGNVNKYICSAHTDSFNSKSNVTVTTESGAKIYTSTEATSNVATLKYGQTLTIDSATRHKGANCQGGYYKVYYNGKINYVCADYVFNTQDNAVVSNIDGAIVTSGPSASYTRIKTLKYNTHVSLIHKTLYKGTGCSAGWYKIKLNGYHRYICSTYVSLSSMTGTINENGTNIRYGAGTNYYVNATLNKNTTVMLLSQTKYKGTGCSAGWYKIALNRGTRYVCSSYVTTTGDYSNKVSSDTTTSNTTTNNSKTVTKVTLNTSNHYYTTNKWTYKINENYATVRKTAGGTFQEYIYLGTEVKPLSTSGQYTKISYHNGKTGWIFTRLIDEYSKVTKTDSSYCTKLKNTGFPESYCPYLSYLHSKYPNWTFTPENTQDTFANAVINESRKNYTQTNVTEYITSNTIVEKPDWRVASDPYTAYLLDPRNYLNEKNIFAFEDLSYNSSYHTKTAVRNVLKSTYLDTDTYASYFVNAGKTYKISPIHLASRVKQEGGSNSTYTPVSGTVTSTWKLSETGYVCSIYAPKSGTNPVVRKGYNLPLQKGPGVSYTAYKYPNGNTIKVNIDDTLKIISDTTYTGGGCTGEWYKVEVYKSLKGYYNYYNIGAYGDNPTLRGLAAAAGYVDDLEGTPWNSREKAITYGAKFIAEGYINKGQDTLFYQKFNVGPRTSNKYTHQYMTNIIAPASESLSTYYLYNTTNYVFKIPVYKNMPTEHTSHPPVGSIEKHLNALK